MEQKIKHLILFLDADYPINDLSGKYNEIIDLERTELFLSVLDFYREFRENNEWKIRKVSVKYINGNLYKIKLKG